MKLVLKKIGSNMTELETEAAVILFSYQTPVAALVRGQGIFKTKTHYSPTTTKHVNKWLKQFNAYGEEVEQSFIDSLVQPESLIERG